MDYQEYIKSELLVLVPVLYIIGLALKRSRFEDKWIPLMLGIVSIILSALWVVSTSHITNYQDVTAALFTAITQGILAVGASVYANQLYVQANKDA